MKSTEKAPTYIEVAINRRKNAMDSFILNNGIIQEYLIQNGFEKENVSIDNDSLLTAEKTQKTINKLFER